MKITIKSQIGNGEINEEIEFKGDEQLEVYVQDNIEDKITELMLENDYGQNYVFNATCKDDKVIVN